jgi:quercetin dioxygenase-like cupin family protein
MNLSQPIAMAFVALALGGCIHVRVHETVDSRGDEPSVPLCQRPASGSAAIVSTPVASQAIADAPGKTLTSVRLDVPPGARANPHMHAGMVFVYVLEGTVCSQVTGDTELKPYSEGQSFFEPPGSQHLGFANPGSRSASVLVTFVANTGAQLTRPVP